MIRSLRTGAVVWVAVIAWGWLFGPMGFVIGGIAFLAGTAVGHRTGRADAEREHRAAWLKYGRPQPATLHSIEGDR